MHMIRYASYAVALATTATGCLGEIRVELWAYLGIEQGNAVLGAEDYMDEDRREGLRHDAENKSVISRMLRLGRRDISRFQRLSYQPALSWGLRPRLGYAAPSGLAPCHRETVAQASKITYAPNA